MTSRLIFSLTFWPKSGTGRRRVRGVLWRWVMVGEECEVGWRWSAKVGWGMGERWRGSVGYEWEVGPNA